MQPWLAKGPFCEFGPYVPAGCQLASCMPSPVLLNHTTIWTGVSGYHSGEPFGHGDFIVQGESFPRMCIAPTSVGSVGRPVVTAVSMMGVPWSRAVSR